MSIKFKFSFYTENLKHEEMYMNTTFLVMNM